MRDGRRTSRCSRPAGHSGFSGFNGSPAPPAAELVVRRGRGGAVVKPEPVAGDWPTFDAPLLRDIAAAFRRRRKAIAYCAGLSCGREFTESAAGAAERLNLDAGALRLSAWPDGVMWLAVCVRGSGRGAGWAF